MQWLAGMRLTADRMNDNTADEETVAGASAASGFTLGSFSARKLKGVTFISIQCTSTGTISETAGNSGNINDTSFATLPVGWRPPEDVEAVWNSGFNDGGATINTSGLIQLRTTSGSSAIASGNSPRVTATWISENS